MPLLPRHLPEELLLLVLEYASGAEAHDARSLSHVDGRWRKLALITPGLWTVLDSRLGSDGAREYAARSGQLPLDVKVVHRGVGSEAILLLNRVIGRFMDVALQHSARWSSFTADTLLIEALMHVTDTCAQHFLLKLGHYPGSMRVLDSVTLRVNANLAHEYHEQPYRQLRCAPFSTRSLCLDAVPAWEREYFTPTLERLELHSLAPSRQCGQLEEPCVLHWREPDMTPGLFRLVDVLTLSPNLRELVLDGSGPRLSGSQPVPVELRHLRTITLRSMTTEVAKAVLDAIIAPSLREMALHLNGSPDGLLLALATLSRLTEMTHLTLALSKPPAAPYLICGHKGRKRKSGNAEADSPPDPNWAALQQLESLSLEGTRITDPGLAALSTLPHFRSLSLRSEPQITFSALEWMLRARLADTHVPALLHLEVVWCENFISKHAPALQELVPELVWMACEDDGEDDGDFDPLAEASSSDDDDISDDSDPVSEAALSPLRPRHQLRLP